MTKHFDLDKLIAIIDAINVRCDIAVNLNWTADHEKAFVLRSFADKDWIFKINKDNKKDFLKAISDNLNDSDYCHYVIRTNDKEIGKGYDHCEINFINPNFFKITEEFKNILGDSEIVLTEEVELN